MMSCSVIALSFGAALAAPIVKKADEKTLAAQGYCPFWCTGAALADPQCARCGASPPPPPPSPVWKTPVVPTPVHWTPAPTPIRGCADSPYYSASCQNCVTPVTYSCSDWAAWLPNFRCTDAGQFGYTKAQEQELINACPATCGTCMAKDSKLHRLLAKAKKLAAPTMTHKTLA